MEGEVSHSGDSPLSVFSFRNFSFGQSLVLALLLLAGEVAVQLWYASAPRAVTADWRVEMPRANPSFKQAELPKTAVKLLRFNEAQSGAWQNADGTRWQMIYLRWNPGRTAVHLARSHTPETCLPAAGRHPRSITEISPIPAGPVQMPFRCFTTGSESQPLFVFYSLWEDGAPRPSLAKQQLTWRTRFEAALERRRNPGQRVLQFGVWGARDAVHAEELLRAELPTLIAKAESGNGEGRKLK